MLAGGLHAILAQRELGRRLALSQQADAVAQALGEALDVEIPRLGGLRALALGAQIAFQVDHQRRRILALGRLLQHLDLLGPALQQEGDEGELPLAEFVRVRHAEQQRAHVGDARRSVVDVAVEVVLDRVLGHVQRLRPGVAIVQFAPYARRHLPVGAVVVEHLQSRIGKHPLADQPGLRAHAGLARRPPPPGNAGSPGASAPTARACRRTPRSRLRHRQRAVGEAPRLLDLDELHRLAQRLQRRQAADGLGVVAVELLHLREQLVLGCGDIRQRHVLQPGLGGRRVDEFRRRLGGELGKLQIFHGGIVGDLADFRPDCPRRKYRGSSR